jgi:hypothetical protein
MKKKIVILTAILAVYFFPGNAAGLDIFSDNPIKAALGDVTIGSPGLGASIGLRYDFIGLSFGMAGFLNSTPAYGNRPPQGVDITPSEPLPAGYEDDRITTILVDLNAHFFYNLKELDAERITLFGTVGYFAQNDTILAKDISTGFRYRYRSDTKSGLQVGGGIEYEFNLKLNVGAGFLSRRGLLLRVAYVWI